MCERSTISIGSDDSIALRAWNRRTYCVTLPGCPMFKRLASH